MLIINVVSMFSLWLSGLRRPTHDTFTGIVHERAWLSTVLASGDWAWWMPYVRYGFSFSTFHFSKDIIDPLGILLALFVWYDTPTYGIDLVLHSLMGGLGAYLLGCHFLRTKIASLAVGIGFAGAGVVVVASLAGAVHAGYMTLPWIILALARVVNATDNRTLAGAIGLLAISLGWLVASGYPATWFTLPIFAAPYTLILAGSSARRLFRTAGSCVAACVLAATVLAPWVAETIFTPLFGGAVRNPVDPNEGAAPASAVFGLILANPNLFPNSSVSPIPPVYLGLISGLAMFWQIFGWLASTSPRVRNTLGVIGALALTVAATPLSPIEPTDAIFVRSRSEDWHRESLALTGFLLLLCAASPKPLKKWDKKDIALAVSGALACICATDNIIGKIIRTALPPFIWSRWSYYYLGFSMLTALLLAWRGLEVALLTTFPLSANRSWNPAVFALTAFASIPAIMFFTPSLSPQGEEVSRIGIVTFIWLCCTWVLYLVVGMITWRITLRKTASQRSLSTFFLVLAPLVVIIATLLAGWGFNRRDALIREFFQLPKLGLLYIQIFHVLSVVGVSSLVWKYAPRRMVLQGISVIAIFDIIISASGYYSVVGGGFQNTASATYGVVGGGYYNIINSADFLAE